MRTASVALVVALLAGAGIGGSGSPLAQTPPQTPTGTGVIAGRVVEVDSTRPVSEAIDTVMKLGMNHPMGPLTLADFIGLDVCLAILNVLHDGFGDPKYRPCPLLKRMVAAGQLGRKTGQGFYKY